MNVAVDARSEGSYADEADGWEGNTIALIEGAAGSEAGIAWRRRLRWSSCAARSRERTLRSTLRV